MLTRLPEIDTREDVEAVDHHGVARDRRRDRRAHRELDADPVEMFPAVKLPPVPVENVTV